MSLLSVQEGQALIADRLRIWEVRRACQVVSHGISGDAASSALLRCLLYELHGDIAAVTLLDDKNQHFLSVIPRSEIHNPHVTQETGKWYGCQSISHHGGLCIRTITLKDPGSLEPVFEIFDLRQGTTRLLPVVDGSVAHFRYYVGVPLSISGGVRIGTLFVFRDEPAQQGLPRPLRHFIHETARQLIDQIYLTVEALQNGRALRCNSAVLSLLEICGPSNEKGANIRDQFSHIYQNAARLLLHAFELEGVAIQEFPCSMFDASPRQPTPILGYHSKSGKPAQDHLPNSVAKQLIETFPQGSVCHLLNEANGYGTFAASVPGSPEFSVEFVLQLLPETEAPEQFMFMPLQNTYHDKVSGFILGWAIESSRVYSSKTDLLPLSSFGAAIMGLVRRAEEQVLDRKKNDFLGSVSHEMRSPLHGVLACIDLARETESRTQQLELLSSASSCALQLRDNIDNILMYSNIGSPSPSLKQHKQPRLRTGQDKRSYSQSDVGELESPDIFANIMQVIEGIVVKERNKSQGRTPSLERREDALSVTVDSAWQTIIVVDSTPDIALFKFLHPDVDIIISNLLGNCLKFTGPSGCIRVSFEADETNVRLLFADTACGISKDFAQHKLFVPFAQQDPLEPGMGLGLSLVHGAVQRLGGDISFHTDEAEGTDFSVSLPRARLAYSIQETRASSGTESSLNSVVDFSSMDVQILPPERWKGEGGDHIRNQRCLDAFVTSLRRTLESWCMVDLKLCTQPWDVSGTNPDIILLLHSDIERMRQIAGVAFDDTQKIVFCPDESAEKLVRDSVPGQCTTILGPIAPWKIVSAVSRCSQTYRNRAEPLVESANTHGSSPTPTEVHRDDEDTPTHAGASDSQGGHLDSPHRVPPEKIITLPIRTKLANLEREPKILLVDDNAINLRVAGMYAKKCSKQPAISAGGGRTAIEEFKAARTISEPFDIVLLDLSMPEISGFDVAAAVRELELDTEHQGLPRVYIAALTGLVSDKDRDAAFAVGIDEYVTKPASLGDVQNIVTNWRMSRGQC